MLRIGLTGGIGSGKSSVAAMFAELGADVINLDQVARTVVVPGSLALKAIAERYGPQVLQADGQLDRANLRRYLLASQDEKVWLEQLLHPLIRQRSKALESLAAGRYLIVEIPLLVENLEHQDFDRILVVDLPEDLQRARAIARGGMSEEEVDLVMARQATRSRRREVADDLIDNSGSPEHTREQVRALHQTYLGFADSAK